MHPRHSNPSRPHNQSYPILSASTCRPRPGCTLKTSRTVYPQKEFWPPPPPCTTHLLELILHASKPALSVNHSRMNPPPSHSSPVLTVSLLSTFFTLLSSIAHQGHWQGRGRSCTQSKIVATSRELCPVASPLQTHDRRATWTPVASVPSTSATKTRPLIAPPGSRALGSPVL